MKRIDVDILKSTSRTVLPPKAQLMFNSRHPISDISEYAAYIDSTQFDFYNKDDETHIVLRIKTENEVDVSTFYEIQQLFVLAELFCKENNIEDSAKDVSMKVQMESPGLLHFISTIKISNLNLKQMASLRMSANFSIVRPTGRCVTK